MARAMWKACLQFGRKTLPVKLYAAVEDRTLHLRLLHAADRVPVNQRMVDPRTDREVPSDQIRRGIEIEPGVFVLLRPEELEAIAPLKSTTVEITRFVPQHAVDVAWYQRPYWLGPDGSDEQYAALATALDQDGRVGIARWVMRGIRYFGVLEPRRRCLSLLVIHARNEVVPANQLERPQGPPVSGAERKLAEQLVATLDEPFRPQTLQDEHRERLEALIAAKKAGTRFEVPEGPAPQAPSDLTEALRQSLRAARERSGAAA